ncbi:coil containing protein [Vibrio phage 1.015.O._10N.222.51.E5]|nr:coil containing protein [Vibrio phage 1.015.O._10N.222.51.E5]
MRLIGTTPNGKKIFLGRIERGNGKVLQGFKFGDGGELPKELQGAFLDMRQAETAVAKYLARLADKKEAETIVENDDFKNMTPQQKAARTKKLNAERKALESQ